MCIYIYSSEYEYIHRFSLNINNIGNTIIIKHKVLLLFYSFKYTGCKIRLDHYRIFTITNRVQNCTLKKPNKTFGQYSYIVWMFCPVILITWS